MLALLAGIACAVAIAFWWLFFSRALWSERIGAIVLMVVAVLGTRLVVHESIATAPGGDVVSHPCSPCPGSRWSSGPGQPPRGLSDGARRAALVVAILLACAPFTIIRTAGLIGVGSELHWRWTPTPEERLLAQAGTSLRWSHPYQRGTRALACRKRPL